MGAWPSSSWQMSARESVRQADRHVHRETGQERPYSKDLQYKHTKRLTWLRGVEGSGVVSVGVCYMSLHYLLHFSLHPPPPDVLRGKEDPEG